jgi:DAK2 domain fusion protein YloV
LREYITAADFKDMILCADAALRANTQAINELNVFPVPDGDTGTNMSLTVGNAAFELRKRDFASLSDAADCTSSGLLRGARGNSGVITSLLFRGMSRRLKGMSKSNAQDFACAMSDGVDAAYKAVMKPAEGTILTVSRKSAEAAVDYTKNGGFDVERMLELSIQAAKEALDDTINLNPVLKKAGVVDAGGKGFVIIYEAMLSFLRGTFTVPSETAPAAAEDESGVFEKFSTEDITFAYDTVFIVRRTEQKPLDLLRAYLDSIGDSLVIGEDDECFKVHVHTNIPGDALTEAQKYGTLETAKIENMRTQHDELVENSAPAPETNAEPEKEFGSVAVCAGEGMANIFREIGADSIVTGGQTMNPSTDDILREINRTPARTVFVFPNNKNIIMAAQQCEPLTDKKVIVMPTKSVPQGISALLCLEPDVSEENLIEAMSDAMDRVHTAQITYAARDSEFDGSTIKAGEYLALLDGGLLGSYTDLSAVLQAVGAAAAKYSPEMITLYYGEDVDETAAKKTADELSGVFPGTEISVVYGGQPVYYYMISIE